MDRLIHFFFFTCNRATLLIEQHQNGALSLLNRFKLRMHLKVCKACTNYAKQSELIEEILNMSPPNLDSHDLHQISETAKSQMHQVLKEKMKKK